MVTPDRKVRKLMEEYPKSGNLSKPDSWMGLLVEKARITYWEERNQRDIEIRIAKENGQRHPFPCLAIESFL